MKLYAHPFSSYCQKALIALYENDTPFEFRLLEGEAAFAELAALWPVRKFPVLQDGDRTVVEATAIIEHLAVHHPGPVRLIPADPAAAEVRLLDRVFDNYVMAVMQSVVNEYLRDGAQPDLARVAEARAQLDRVYAWLDARLADYPASDTITLVECAAAPALFYADWVHPISDAHPRLKGWRAQLLALPPVRRCVDEARPYREFFPLGAPDRD